MSYISNIKISEKTFNEIKSVLGYPVITSEFDDIMTPEHIKEYAIAPAMETYFTYFPVIHSMEYPASGSSALETIEAPDNTLGLLKYQFIPQSSSSGGANLMQQGMFYGNPFYTSSQVVSKGSYGLGGSFGTPFGYEKELFTYQNRFYNKSLESSNKVVFIRYDDNTNSVELKSNLPGVFHIELALFSNDVEVIPIRKRQKFIEYAQGKLLKKFANILKISESDLPSSLDSDYLNDEGDRLIEQAEEYFREASFIPMAR